MLSARVIACLDVRAGRVVKGVAFQDLRDQGDPVELALRYEEQGADEIVFLDVSATLEERRTTLDLVQRTAEQLFIPLTVGGGVRSANDMDNLLRAGADKVAINSAAVARPRIISECSRRFGAQCVVVSVDAKRGDGHWLVHTHGGRRTSLLDAVEWAEHCAALGAGEILLTSIDRDGSREGYDLALTDAVVRRVSVPVIASGGAGSASDVVRVITESDADAALVAGVLHDGSIDIATIKQAMAASGIPVRDTAHV